VTFGDVGEVIRRFDEQGYLLDEGTAAAFYRHRASNRPLLLEGEPGWARPPRPKPLRPCWIRR
jgi:MoxR-like ATPase